MCGMPGSGKSTYVNDVLKKRYNDIVVISRDIIRHELGYSNSVDDKKVLSKTKEQEVTEREYEMIDSCINAGLPFVIDDMNGNSIYRGKLIEFLKSKNVDITIVNIITDIDTCIRRREGQISDAAMHRIESNFEYFGKIPGVKVINCTR